MSSNLADIVESHSSIPDDIRDEFVKMQSRYRGVELDSSLSIEEKIPHMIDWAENGEDLFVKAKVNKNDLPQMVEESHVFLRDGFNELVKKMHNSQVPLLIFSAGIGDVLEEVLLQCSEITPGMKFVANYMAFDNSDCVVGFESEFIHTFNKNGDFVTSDQEWVENTLNRGNVILLGDMIGDVTMADGVSDPKTSLKIGFLNCNYQELLDVYLDKFDIVLENDQTMDMANCIIDGIINK